MAIQNQTVLLGNDQQPSRSLLPVGLEFSAASGHISLPIQHPLQGSAQAHSLQRTFWNVVLRHWPRAPSPD